MLWGQPTSFQSKGLELGRGSFPLRSQGPGTGIGRLRKVEDPIAAWPLLKGRRTGPPPSFQLGGVMEPGPSVWMQVQDAAMEGGQGDGEPRVQGHWVLLV